MVETGSREGPKYGRKQGAPVPGGGGHVCACVCMHGLCSVCVCLVPSLQEGVGGQICRGRAEPEHEGLACWGTDREALGAAGQDGDPLVLVLRDVPSGHCVEEGRRPGGGGFSSPL